MTQLCTMCVGSNSSWNWNEGQSLVKPPLFCSLRVTQFGLSSATTPGIRSVTPGVGICVLDPLAQSWKPCLVRAVGIRVWMFPVGWHSLHVVERTCVCSFPGAFSVAMCLLVVLSQTRQTTCSTPTRYWPTRSRLTFLTCFTKLANLNCSKHKNNCQFSKMSVLIT